MIDTKCIPSSVVIPSDFEVMDSELRSDVRKLQEAYSTLRDMPDYDCPTSLSELTRDEIDRLTTARISRVEADDTLLASEKEERIKKFKSLSKVVVTHLNTINRILSEWSEAQFVYDARISNIVPTANLRGIVEARCSKPVPEICKQHARLIDNALQAIIKLREFEQAEDVSKLRLEMLAAMDSDGLAALWASGQIKRPVVSSDPWMQRAEIGRKFAESQYL